MAQGHQGTCNTIQKQLFYEGLCYTQTIKSSEYNAMCIACVSPTSTYQYLKILLVSGMLPYVVTGSPCYSLPTICLMYLSTSAYVVVTGIKQTPIIDCYLAWPVVMNEHQRNTYYKNDWTMCSEHMHKCEGVCDHLKRKQEFTLIYYDFCMSIGYWNLK